MKQLINLRTRAGRLLAALSISLFGALAMAETGGSSPAASLDAAQIATDGTATLTGLVGDALPFIVAAIGLGIALRWVRKVFKF